MSRGGVDLRFRPWRQPPERICLWVEEALARDTAAPVPLAGTVQTDVCIVGGGFSGLWTALRLREQDAGIRIAVVEADLCGTGASGRNSGATGHWWGRLPLLAKCLGRDEAARVIAASEAAVADIRAFADDNAISCELRSEPSVWSVTAPGRPGAWEAMFRAAEHHALAPPHRRLSADELRAMFGRAPVHGGVLEESATRLQPALLARGLRRIAAERGIEIFERSPVTAIASAPREVVVSAGRAAVRTGKVVLAANAWMAHLAPFRAHVMVLSSEMIVTPPIPDRLRAAGLGARPGGINSRQMLNYGGITPAGRVYLGRGGGTIAYRARVGPLFEGSPACIRELSEDFRHLHPELADIPIERGWGGPIDRSTTGLPRFGRLAEDPRIHFALGYTGHGVGAAALGGRVLASAVLERSDEWSALGESLGRVRNGRFPPEPLRYMAATIVQRAVARKERAERDGLRPARLDALLAPVAQATLPEATTRPETVR